MITLIVTSGITHGQVEFETMLNLNIQKDASISKSVAIDSTITTSETFVTENLGLETDE
jgi:hypothetical protein